MALLIVGPRNCGKSVLAEDITRSLALGEDIVYLATLPELPEYRKKIERHRERRSNQWVLDHASCLAEANSKLSAIEGLCLLDGLEALLSNLFRNDRNALLRPERLIAGVLRKIASIHNDTVIVLGYHKMLSNLVPDATSRLLRHGWANTLGSLPSGIQVIRIGAEDSFDRVVAQNVAARTSLVQPHKL